MIHFEIPNLYTGRFDESKLRTAVETALEYEHIDNAELTIAIEDSTRLHELNLQFSGIDAPTDVLSFTAREMNPETNLLYLGDVIISFPIAEAQAQSSGHSVDAELQLLVVHGTLHLAGHDHSSIEEKEAMWKAQNEILTKIDCPLTKFPD